MLHIGLQELALVCILGLVVLKPQQITLIICSIYDAFGQLKNMINDAKHHWQSILGIDQKKLEAHNKKRLKQLGEQDEK